MSGVAESVPHKTARSAQNSPPAASARNVGRRCETCWHSERDEIDKRLLAGEPVSVLARAYGLTRDSVNRHMAAHVAPALREAAAREREQAEEARGDDLLGELRSLLKIAKGLLARAVQAGDLRTATSAVGQARGVIETMARVLGDISDAPTVNVTLAPQFIQIRQTLITALEPFPEARAAVLRALEAAQ